MKLRKRLLTIALVAALLIPAGGIGVAAEQEWITQEYVILTEDREYPGDVKGGLDLDGHQVVVTGDFVQSEPLHLNGGTLIVRGNFYNNAPDLQVDDGLLQVNGNFFHNGETALSGNGTLKVGGNMSLGNTAFTFDGGELSVGGDFLQQYSLNLNGGVMTVDGAYYHQKGTLTIGGGRLYANGGYYLRGVATGNEQDQTFEDADAVLKMNQPEDVFICDTMFWSQSIWGRGPSYNYLTDGTLELKGDFRQCGNFSGFSAENNHKVIFSGTENQTVQFDGSSSGFNILCAGSNDNVDILNGRIRKVEEDATLNRFIQYGDLDLNGNKLTITGELVESGHITVNGGTLQVGEDFIHQDGSLDLDNGRVEVGGDYRLQTRSVDERTGKYVYDASNGTLKMNNERDYFFVDGDFYTQSQWGSGPSYNHLTNGLLDLRGDFCQIRTNASDSNFNATDQHHVKFAGNEHQIVHFDSSSSGFGILLNGGNENVAITNGRISQVGEDTVIGSFVQYGSLDLNGKTLTINGELVEDGNITVNQGTLQVGDDFIHENGSLDLNNGRIEVSGDYRLQSRSLDERSGKYEYTTSDGTLKMNDSSDYFLVEGDFYTQSRWGSGPSYNNLIAGTLELKGDFTQIAENGNADNFNAQTKHRVIFSGNENQTIDFETPKQSGFFFLMRTDNQNVDITSGRISYINGNVTLNSFNQYGSMNLFGKSLTVTETMTQNGNVNLAGGKCRVKGDYLHQDGILDCNKGSLTVEGDYRCQKAVTDESGNVSYSAGSGVIRMMNVKDTFTVMGDFYTQSQWGSSQSYNYLIAGTLELKGDFTQIAAGGNATNFDASQQHKTRLTGENQKIVFESKTGSGLNILCDTDNGNADIDGQVKSIEGEVTVGSFTQYGTLNLKGASLCVTGDMIQNGKVDVNAGTLTVSGDYSQSSGILDLNNGSMSIDGDYRIQKPVDNGTGGTDYQASTGVLQMNQPFDVLSIGGSFITQSVYGSGSSYNDLTNGELRIGGDFTQLNGSSINFTAGKDHLTIFTGTYLPVISFQSANSGFGTVVFENFLGEDVLSESSFRYQILVDEEHRLNLSTLSADRVVTGESFEVTPRLFGGKGPYTMSVYQKKTTETKYHLLQNDTEARILPLTIQEVGDYDIRIRIMSSDGVYTDREVKLTVADVLTNTSTLKSSSVLPTDQIVVNCSADGGTGVYQYEVSIRETSETAFTKVRDYSSVSSVSIEKPVGTYEVLVRVKDSSGKVVKKKLGVKVEDLFTVTASLSAGSIELGQSVTVNAAFNGGTAPYTVGFYYRPAGTSSWKTIQAFGEKTSAVFRPDAAGTYDIYLKGKDSTGRLTSCITTLTVMKPAITALRNVSTVSADRIRAGKTVTVNCLAEGGSAPYTYAVYYKKSASSSYSAVQSYSENAIVNVRLASATSYDILVKVKDSTGKIVRKTFTVQAVKALSNTSTVSSYEVTLGNTVTLYGAAEGGFSPYTYAYYYKKSSSSSWTTLKSYSSKTSVTLKPGGATAYDIMIKVKDSNNTVVKKTFTLTVSKA